MASAKKSVKSRPATEQDVADIVGSFLVTFGQGIAPLHVHRSAVRAIRKRFESTVGGAILGQKHSSTWNADWEKDAATVLGWMAAVGRLAAHGAMSQGRTVVAAKDFEKALSAVIAEHHDGSKPSVSLGKYCM